MSETLLIIIGVAVFAVTIVGVLIYFYSILAGLEGVPGGTTIRESPPLAARGDV